MDQLVAGIAEVNSKKQMSVNEEVWCIRDFPLKVETTRQIPHSSGHL